MKKIILITIFLLVYLYSGILENGILLTDDLATGFKDNYLRRWNLGYFDFILKYLDTPNMTSRPISSFFFYSVIYLMKFNSKFYYLNYVFFLISIFVIYITSSKIIPKNYSIIFIVFYALIPFGTSLVFSPIMMNSNIATIFYCLSIICLFNKAKGYYYISILFMLFSILSYEIFIPLVFLNIFFVKGSLYKKLLYLICLVSLFLCYKKIIEPNVFHNFTKREKIENLFHLKRYVILVYLSIKMILIDFPKSIYKSFIAIKYFTLVDFFVLLIYLLSSIYIIFKTNFQLLKSNSKITFFSIYALFLCFIIYSLSNYDPTLYGFSNRTLGGVRLFFSLFLVMLAYYFSTKRCSFNQVKFKIIISIFLVLFTISSISIKNAWQYSDNYNKKLFSKLKTQIHHKMKSRFIYINYRDEEYSKDIYILREPIFLEHWETVALKKWTNIPVKYDIYDYKNYLNKFPDKYYIYDYPKNKLNYIETK